SFHQIASDGGFLEEPVKMDKMVLGPAERAEILVDFSNLNEGETIKLENSGSEFMKFTAKKERGKKYNIPTTLTTIEKMDADDALNTDRSACGGRGPRVNSNGKQLDIHRIDEELDRNDTEIWEVSNESGMGMMAGTVHPLHAHGTQFHVLDRDRHPPPPNEA